jgi:uncharacterized membrane protein (UPF0127 family)
VRALLVFPALLFSGCLAAVPDNDALPVEQACLISTGQAVPITVEVARTSAERSRGLMGRERLAADAGMLFVYTNQRRADHGFWMYRTLIPLDIAYLDRDGVIGAIRPMVPCRSDQGRDCPTYEAGVPFHLALEMNLGYFENHDIDVGARLSLEPSDCR